MPLPVEKVPTQAIPISKGLEKSGVKISYLLNYPVRTLVYEGGNSLKDLADLVATSCLCLQENNIPFNVLISDSGRRIFLFPQVRKLFSLLMLSIFLNVDNPFLKIEAL